MQGIRAILFDMDGTITRPHIDFKSLRARIGVPEGSTIVAYIESLPEDQARAADAILLEAEMDAADNAVANDGLDQLFARLYDLPLKLALITNNHRAAM